MRKTKNGYSHKGWSVVWDGEADAWLAWAGGADDGDVSAPVSLGSIPAARRHIDEWAAGAEKADPTVMTLAEALAAREVWRGKKGARADRMAEALRDRLTILSWGD